MPRRRASKSHKAGIPVSILTTGVSGPSGRAFSRSVYAFGRIWVQTSVLASDPSSDFDRFVADFRPGPLGLGSGLPWTDPSATRVASIEQRARLDDVREFRPFI